MDELDIEEEELEDYDDQQWCVAYRERLLLHLMKILKQN